MSGLRFSVDKPLEYLKLVTCSLISYRKMMSRTWAMITRRNMLMG